MGAWYLDTSAATKLIVEEPESEAFRAWAAGDDVRMVACELTRTELIRAVRRRAPSLVGDAVGAWEAVEDFPVPATLFRAAAFLEPAGLGTLDALHLAAALDLGGAIEGIATYDARLASAAAAQGLAVTSPGV